MGQLGVHPALGASCTPKPQSLFALLAPEALDAAFSPQKHLCVCLTWAQAAPWNSIIPPYKADFSVIEGEIK